MEMNIIHPQRSDGWRRERLGHVTSSRMKDVMGTRGGAATYAKQLMAERLTGMPMPDAGSPSLKWGRECEPFACDAYETATGNKVAVSGFVRHPAMAWVGVSPDGLVGDDGAVEIKSPYNSDVHLDTWRYGMPAEHKPQTQAMLWVCERAWIDFVSYDPRMPPHLRLYIERIFRDELFIARMKADTERLLAAVAVDMAQLEAKALAAFHQNGEAA